MSPQVAQSERASRASRTTRSRPRSRTSRGAPTPGRGAVRIAWIIAGAVVVLLFLAVAERALYSGKVMPGVHVEGVDVAGDRERAAYDEIADLGDRLDTKPVHVRIAGKQYD